MGIFVPGFKHDVFISYAHASNERLTQEDEGWVTKFHENLTQFLTAELGRKEYFSIWRDNDELRGNDDFETRIDMGFLNSALLVSVCSQSYIESAWCRKELSEFSRHRHPPFELKVGDADSYRVFRVDLGPIRQAHPEIPDFFINRMLGHKFFETEDGVDQPFRRTNPDDDDQQYWKAMRRLARDIAQLLRQMKNLAQPLPVATVVNAGKTVYLAETAEDLDERRSQVRSALEQYNQIKSGLAEKGIRVIPEFPLSLANPSLADEIRQALRGADLAVHLVGQWPGRSPVKEPRPIVKLQWELAAEVAAEKSLPRLVWLADDLDLDKVKDPHKAFINSLEEEHGARAPSEILRVGIEELREILLLRLYPPAAPSAPAEEEEINRLVYLTYLPADRDGAVQVKELLRQERLDVKLFRYEDRDPQMLARIHNASLEKSDGVMIFYGSDAVWVDQLVEQARDAVRARARKNPVKIVCICDGPPALKDNPVEVEYEKFIIADCRDGVRPEDLKKFVDFVKA